MPMRGILQAFRNGKDEDNKMNNVEKSKTKHLDIDKPKTPSRYQKSIDCMVEVLTPPLRIKELPEAVTPHYVLGYN